MNEQTIKELMEPIKAYIQSNQVTYNDIHIIVQNLFPDEDKVRQIATYLNEHVPQFRSLGLVDDKLYERTRQVLTNALTEAALDCLYAKEGYDEDEICFDYSDLDDEDIRGLLDEDWEVGEVDDDDEWDD